MPKILPTFCAVIAFASVAHASPTVLFESASNRSTFTPGLSLSLSSGWLIRDYRPTWPDATQFAAMPFSLAMDSTLTGVELAITSLASWSGNYSVQILEDGGGIPAASSIWQANNLTVAPVFIPGGSYGFSNATGSSLNLSANITYWLFVGCQSNCELTWWADQNNPLLGAIQYNNVQPYNLRWTTSQSGAAMFRILGDANNIPEPTTLALLLLSGVLLFTTRRRPV